MGQRTKSNCLRDEITVMVEETETRHHAMFGAERRRTNKAKHTSWECVADAHCRKPCVIKLVQILPQVGHMCPKLQCPNITSLNVKYQTLLGDKKIEIETDNYLHMVFC